MACLCNGVNDMAVKRIISEEQAEKRTFENARRDVDMLDPGPERTRKEAVMVAMRARRNARGRP